MSRAEIPIGHHCFGMFNGRLSEETRKRIDETLKQGGFDAHVVVEEEDDVPHGYLITNGPVSVTKGCALAGKAIGLLIDRNLWSGANDEYYGPVPRQRFVREDGRIYCYDVLPEERDEA